LPDAPAFTRIAVNAEYCRVFGVKKIDVIEASSLSLIAHREIATVRKKLTAAVESRSPMLSTETAVRPDGSRVRVRWLDFPLTDCESGAVVEMIAIGEVIEEG
jgi:PAS domain S-box-containing protein